MRRAVLFVVLSILLVGCYGSGGSGWGKRAPQNPYEPNTPEYALWNQNQELRRHIQSVEMRQWIDRYNSQTRLQQHESQDFYQRQLERPLP